VTSDSSNALSDYDVSLVQSSWLAVKPIAETAATIFYDRLFALDPALRGLFPDDLREQKKKLMATLDFAVLALKKPEALLPAVRMLGQRHVGYGVTAEHYGTVGAALLFTLEQGLGGAFTSEVRSAWTKTYSTLSNTMLEAAAQAVS
jgi:hemoglobin-like flavoprotein